MKNIFRLIIISLTALVSTQASAKPEKYIFDKDHTEIIFTVNHMGFSNKIGYFDDYDGYFIFDQDKPQNSSVEVTIRPKGIDSGSKALDKELQKEAWFDSAKYPEIIFQSSSIELTGRNEADIKGWLTIKGIKKRLTLETKFNKAEVHPITKDFVAGFSADATVRRTLYDMKEYIPFIGDDVKIHIETEGIKQK